MDFRIRVSLEETGSTTARHFSSLGNPLNKMVLLIRTSEDGFRD